MIAPRTSGDEVSISASSAIYVPSAAEALSVSSAAADVEVGVSTEMSVWAWPSLGTTHESVCRRVSRAQSVRFCFPFRAGTKLYSENY